MSFSFVGQRIVWTAKLWSIFSDLAPRMVSIMNFLQQFGPEEVILFLLWTPTSLWSRHCSGGFHLGELRPVDKRMYPLFFFFFFKKLNWNSIFWTCWSLLRLSWTSQTGILSYLSFWWGSSLLEDLWTSGSRDLSKTVFEDKLWQRFCGSENRFSGALRLWYHVRIERKWWE